MIDRSGPDLYQQIEVAVEELPRGGLTERFSPLPTLESDWLRAVAIDQTSRIYVECAFSLGFKEISFSASSNRELKTEKHDYWYQQWQKNRLLIWQHKLHLPAEDYQSENVSDPRHTDHDEEVAKKPFNDFWDEW